MKEVIFGYLDKKDADKLISLPSQEPDRNGYCSELIFVSKTKGLLRPYNVTIIISQKEPAFFLRWKDKLKRIFKIIRES